MSLPFDHARSQTMSTVGAAATSAGGYMYTYMHLYVYIVLYYTIDVCVLLRMPKCKKKVSVRTTKSTF